MRGAVVGGSGAVNGGYFCRALPADFATWRLPGWSWDDVLPHFRAIENDMDFDGPLHGSDGPILVRRVSEFDGCTASFVNAAAEMGYAWVPDINGGAPGEPMAPGIGAVPLNINGGNRIGPGGAYLQPALSRTNLTLLADTRVGRIRFDKRTCSRRGVFRAGWAGDPYRRPDRLVQRGNRIRARPAAVRYRARCRAGSRGNCRRIRSAGRNATSDHPEWVLPVNWTPTHDLPPLEAVLTTPNGLEVRPYTRGFGAMVEGAGEDPADRPHIGVALMQPRSRGRVSVVSDEPDVPPLIEHRYDSDPHDVASLSAGAELARELAESTTKVGEATWSTSQHLCGTAPMGVDGDAAAVVDVQCRVRGVDGLWVVDGSILPTVTSRGPHATIVMLGHRAAEFVVG